MLACANRLHETCVTLLIQDMRAGHVSLHSKQHEQFAYRYVAGRIWLYIWTDQEPWMKVHLSILAGRV